MVATSFPVFDADNHIYENSDALLLNLPKKYHKDIQFVDIFGRKKLLMRGQLTDFMPNPTFERVAAPGSHVEFYRGNNPEGLSLRDMGGTPITPPPSFRAPAPRLALMDEQQVHRTIMFPTVANLVEYTLRDDPELTFAAVHAVNQWILDTWTLNYKDRIIMAPVVTLGLLDKALGELEWLLGAGAKVVLVRPGTVKGWHGERSIGLPEFDPFWARVQEAGIGVCMHASFPPLTDYAKTWEPAESDNPIKRSSLTKMILGHREIEDALAALICQGTLSRFPDLRIMSVENGADWVAPFLHRVELISRMLPKEFSENPVEVFKRNIYINPFWEDDVNDLVNLVGVDRVLFGSDYPHPEGLANPIEYIDYLADQRIDAAATRKIMCDNGNEFLKMAAA